MTANNQANDLSSFKYRAFISYNQHDKSRGAALHSSLEKYSVPRRLRNTPGKYGSIPKKLFPIFRDREELHASSDLSKQIKEALNDSSFLVVVCSPNAVKSKWVNQEILEFKRLGREERILAYIVDGEPNALNQANDNASRECFPPGLKRHYDKDGNETSDGVEPIAADARPEGDGKQKAKLKLIAGLLGVSYDALRQRERERALALMTLWTAVAACVMFAAFGIYAYQSRQREIDALAGQSIAASRGALAQRDYPHAEIEAAKALTKRNTPEAQDLLLTARLAGVKSVRHVGSEAGPSLSALSRDGALIATVLDTSAPARTTVVVTSTGDGAELMRVPLPATAAVPDAMAFSEVDRNLRRLAIAWSDNASPTAFHVGVWEVRPGEAKTFVELSAVPDARHSKRIPALAFHPRQPWLLTAGEDGKLCLWDVASAEPKLLWRHTDAHYPNVHGIAFNPDGSMIASGGGDYVAKIWDTEEMIRAYARDPAVQQPSPARVTLAGHSDSVFAVAFSPDSHRFASGGYDRTVRVWDFDIKKEEDGKDQPQTVATLSGHEGTVLSLAFVGDGALLVSGSSDGTAKLWDTRVGRMLDTFTPGAGIVRSVAAPAFDQPVAVAAEHGWSSWSLGGNGLVTRLWNGGATVGAIAFDPSGNHLAVGGGDRFVRIWDRSGRMVKELDTESEAEFSNGVVFSADGRWLAAGGGDGVVHIWDRNNQWQKIDPGSKTALRHDGPIWGLCFDAKGQWLASSNESQKTPQNVRIRRWNVGTWTLKDESERIPDQVYALACAGDGKRLISGDSRARVVVRDTRDLSITNETTNVSYGELNVWSVGVAANPLSVISGNSDGHVYRWIPSGTWTGAPADQKFATSADNAKVNPTINSVSYNPQNGWIAAGGVGPSVEIYDRDLKKVVHSLKGHDGTIWFVAFDPSGERLAYGGLDGIVRVVQLGQLSALKSSQSDDLWKESQASTGLDLESSGQEPASLLSRLLARGPS